MGKFVSPHQKEINEESLKRIRIRLDLRMERYKEELKKEKPIGTKPSKVYKVKNLLKLEKWEEK